MKIAVNARLLKAFPDDGISRFTFEVTKRLLRDHRQHGYALVFDKKPDKSLDLPGEYETHVIRPASRHPVLWYTWHEWQLPEILVRSGADVFFSPDGIISIRSSVPAVPVIHDINFYHRPGDIPFLTRTYYKSFFNVFAHKASRILTVSDFCRDDISKVFGISQGKIDVAHNGVSEYFAPAPAAETNAFRKELTGGAPYFLFVGNFSPRKNIPALIKSYNLFRQRQSVNARLVLAGARLYLNSETDKLLKESPYRDDIILAGSVKHEDLRLLYSAAIALVFVAWFEGFGIPAAEAMRCGTPAILSGTTSLPEVGGDSALYVNPAEPAEIAEAMVRLVNDDALRASLSIKGITQSAKFTWENTASRVIESIEKAVP